MNTDKKNAFKRSAERAKLSLKGTLSSLFFSLFSGVVRPTTAWLQLEPQSLKISLPLLYIMIASVSLSVSLALPAFFSLTFAKFKSI